MNARRSWAWPLIPAYWLGLRLKDGLRRAGILRVRRLGWPVVSVGSLSAGGAGKTPVVIALAKALLTRGWHVDVLSRGYGRDAADSNFAQQVVADHEDAASRYGDEPTLLARELRTPVWVSADRYFAGHTAEDFVCEATWDFVSETEVEVRAAAPVRGVHLLDDGFQHRQLARTMDIVVVTAEDLDDALLPAGNRREPLAALRRADAVVVREEERKQVLPTLERFLRTGIAIWEIRRQISFPEGAVLQSEVPTYGHIVFCAIARPADFLNMLKEAGVNALNTVTFPDHHAYTAEDMTKLVETCDLSIANGFITTEKDAVKLSPAMRAQLELAGLLVIARLDSSFAAEAEVVRALEARIA